MFSFLLFLLSNLQCKVKHRPPSSDDVPSTAQAFSTGGDSYLLAQNSAVTHWTERQSSSLKIHPQCTPQHLVVRDIPPRSTDRKISIPIVLRHKSWRDLTHSLAVGLIAGTGVQPFLTTPLAPLPFLLLGKPQGQPPEPCPAPRLRSCLLLHPLPAQALPVQRPLLLGPIFNYILVSTCSFLSLQFPLYTIPLYKPADLIY